MSPEMGAKRPEQDLPFPLKTVGTYSCHGVEPGMKEGQTTAKINQDRGSMIYPFGEECPDYDRALFIVMDGHGANGDKVSEYAINKVHEELALCDQQFGPLIEDADSGNISKAFKLAFVTTDEKLRKDASIDAELSGTTAVAVLIVHAKATGKTMLFSANAGDSRAVLLDHANETKDLTDDQKPDTPEEKRRINKAGGYVSPPEVEWGGPARVWLDQSMTLPGLAMARSIGDHLVKSVGVSAEPVVKAFTLNPKDLYLILASDGVWEFIESKEATALVNEQIVKQQLTATDACMKLIESAAAKWRQEEGDYRDDITAICVKLCDLFSKK